MTQPFRITGGRVEQGRAIRFSFAGKEYAGYEGDTLASALLANGVKVMARSIKYHRPRGIVGLGSEDPSALVTVRCDGEVAPNMRATTVALRDGMEVTPQNCWPSLGFDLGAFNGLFGGLMGAGFYNKTFMWPAGAWHFYERIIRRYAGHGSVPDIVGNERRETRSAHVDIVIAGGGPAGLAAARAAAQTGARVILADEGATFGGRLRYEPHDIEGVSALEWVANICTELKQMPNVTLLPSSVVSGCYDHGFFTIVERLPEDGPERRPTERLWKVRASQIVVATGAVERPLIYAGNDRPGTMLASAAAGYAFHYGVACGRSAVVVVNNDCGYAYALQLRTAGIAIQAIVDSRQSKSEWAAQAEAEGIKILLAHAPIRTVGRTGVTALDVQPVSGDGVLSGSVLRLPCDLICQSGGWTPNVQLHAQMGGKMAQDARLGAFVPDQTDGKTHCSAGACNGHMSLTECLNGGAQAGLDAAGCLGLKTDAPVKTLIANRDADPDCSATPHIPYVKPGKSFVDFQNDVTVSDIQIAEREGFRAVEHLKRYTTLGMGTDQGKLSNVNGFKIMAAERGITIGDVGTTRYRPPYTPVSMATVIGHRHGEMAHPRRTGALDAWHGENGATFGDSGAWRRPQFYQNDGDPVRHEVLNVRRAAGMIDVSTLGKLEIHGPDAGLLLDRLCFNRLSTLRVGRARYWLTLRDDGVVSDDGVACRLAEDHYFLTSSTAQAEILERRIEFYLQTEWQDLQVYVTPVAEQWFSAAIAGPAARKVVAALTDDIDVSPDAMPHMSIRTGTLAGVPARLVRASFSGELAFEYYVPANRAKEVWERALEVGRTHGLKVYGTEAMGVMRLEKGHIVIGRDADGRATPDDLGLGGLAGPDPQGLGKRSLLLKGVSAPGRRQLVGVVTTDPAQRLPLGAHIVVEDNPGGAQQSLGFITSLAHSPTLERDIALALVIDGRARLGKEFFASAPLNGASVPVQLVKPVFHDPEGKCVHA